ncbi:MAG: hypothetical protein WD928_01850 [Gammaproteobacteria bacterium]
MNAMIVPFTFLVVVALGWLVTLARLLTRLATYEPRTYAALGRPVLRLWLWQIPVLAASVESKPEANSTRRPQDAERHSGYLPRNPGANGTLLGFVAGGRHRTLRDSECRLLGDRLRALLFTFPAGLAGYVIYLGRMPL